MSFAPRRGDACRHTELQKGQAKLVYVSFACPFYTGLSQSSLTKQQCHCEAAVLPLKQSPKGQLCPFDGRLLRASALAVTRLGLCESPAFL